MCFTLGRLKVPAAKTFEGMALPFTITVSNLVQPENGVATDVMVDGRVTEIKLIQPLKALPASVVTPSGKTIDISAVQPLKALPWISFTPGQVNVLSFVQPAKV